jgi:hypothetical protein
VQAVDIQAVMPPNCQAYLLISEKKAASTKRSWCSRLPAERVLWYTRFRTAAYMTVIGSMIWTTLIVLPFVPLSYLPPIMIGGGPGTWFLIGYVLYLTVGVGGFAALSAILFTIETYERRTLNGKIMLTGLTLLYLGVTGGCILLGIAGATGGYAITIQHATMNAARNLLSSYVNPITTASLIAVAGAGVSIYGMVTATKATAT